jgi:twitching motility protein PilT
VEIVTLSIFLSKLDASGCEKACLVPGEPPYGVDARGQKLPLGTGAVREAFVIEAISDFLSNEDIRGLSETRPRVVRHHHDGRDYVLEVLRSPTGVALSARAIVRVPPKRPSEAQRASQRPPKKASMRPAPRRSRPAEPAVEPRLADRAPSQALPPIELELADPVRARAGVPPAAEHVPSRVEMREKALDDEGAGVVVMNASPNRPPKRTGPARIDALLREMVAKKASDLHLSAGNHPVMRIDGEVHFLRSSAPLASSDVREMAYEIMTDKARADFEASNDADCAYELAGTARFRVNVFEDRNGTGMVLRQIPIEIVSAEKLGLPKACLDLCWLSKGLVVVTGPTGSGKSTTLAAMIDFINKNRTDHIITIEDPVEFVHTNQKCLVNQREVGQHTKSFKNALRAALREDPDIVLVGEMRDLETIAIAIETAETGHLVFGTLHTTTATSTVDRIIDQFPADRQAQIRVMLSESLKGVIAQVLVPKIGGGRVAAHEILLGSSAVSAIVREGKTFQLASVMQTAKGQGMTTMNDSLFALVQKKLVEPKAAWAKAVDKNGLLAMFKSAGIPTTFA